MKRSARYACGFLFMLICAAVFMYLRQFSVPPQSMRYVFWESSFRVFSNGTEEPYESNTYASPSAEDDCSYRFTLTVPEGLYDGYFIFETSGLDISLMLDGTVFYASSVISNDEIVSLAQAHVPLPENAEGRTLTAICRPLGGNALFPPLLRYTDDSSLESDAIAYANLSGIPTGAYAFAFVFICSLFLLSVAWRKPDWSLISLAVAALGLTVHPIAKAYGFYFLPSWFLNWIARDECYIVIILAQALYLFLNRRRDFWRLFGRFTLVSGAIIAALYIISLARGSYFAQYIHFELKQLFLYGVYDWLTYWLTFWMVLVCATISAYSLARLIARTQADARALAVREQLSTESYRMMERKLRDMAALRHEANHQLTALGALYQKGDIAGLGEMLDKLTARSAANQPMVYTQNLALNAILQNAAAQAADAGIHFEAMALTPKSMRIPEEDLCGFVLNMLDNAIDAARKVVTPEKRRVRFQAELNGNFLAIRCENTTDEKLKLNETGWPQTTKADPELHGFGMRQMKEIAEKYGSILDFSYTGNSFTVQTALCLPEK